MTTKPTWQKLSSNVGTAEQTKSIDPFIQSSERANPNMESHGGGPLRSRSSQSPSPSHSASASATSSIHKRKRASEDHAPPFPPSSFSADTRDGALTSNDDLESISARGADSDSDDDSEDAVVDDDEEDYDNDSSMRTFTASRLGNPPSAPRNTKLKTDNSAVKIENSDGAKDAANAGAGAMEIGPVPSIVVKEDPTKIFTDNLQTSGAYTAREESLKKEVYHFVWFILNLVRFYTFCECEISVHFKINCTFDPSLSKLSNSHDIQFLTEKIEIWRCQCSFAILLIHVSY